MTEPLSALSVMLLGYIEPYLRKSIFPMVDSIIRRPQRFLPPGVHNLSNHLPFSMARTCAYELSLMQLFCYMAKGVSQM